MTEDAIAPPPDQRIAEAERGVIEAAVLSRHNPLYTHLLELAVDELLARRLRAERDRSAS